MKRLNKEYKELLKDPPGYFTACPDESDLFTWWVIFAGPADTMFEGGLYLARIVLPKEYPFKAPGVQMRTPSGRFTTGKDICMTITNWHQELWNPAWTVKSVVLGLISFMTDPSQPTGVGSTQVTKTLAKEYAQKSVPWTTKHDIFKRYFSDFPDKYKQWLQEEAERKHKNEEEEKERKRKESPADGSDPPDGSDGSDPPDGSGPSRATKKRKTKPGDANDPIVLD